MDLPEKGRDKQEILAEMERYRNGDIDYKKGKIFSLIYDHSEEHTAFLKKAYALFFSENGLNPMAFESLKRFESEVVRMTAGMLHGDSGTVGTLTSGGTESCMLAVKSYRDRLLKRRPWIRRAELIVPESIHVAFEKGADYFGVRLHVDSCLGGFLLPFVEQLGWGIRYHSLIFGCLVSCRYRRIFTNMVSGLKALRSFCTGISII